MKRIIALLMLVPGFAWGQTAIQDLNELTAPAAGDILYIEDVSDTTEDVTGTGKHIQLTNLFQDVGMLNFDAAETITISTGAATVTQSNVILAAEGAGTTDTVDSITRSGIQAGDVVILRADSGDTITIANGTTGGDNLDLGSDVVLDSTNETLTLIYNGTNWVIAATSPNLLTVARTETESFTILEPDAVRAVSDGIVLKKFIAEDYPNGVTITAIHIDASASYTSEVFNIEEWNASASPTPSTIEAITLTAASTGEDDGTIDDGAMAADGFLAVDLDDTPEDIAFVTITVTWTVD